MDRYVRVGDETIAYLTPHERQILADHFYNGVLDPNVPTTINELTTHEYMTLVNLAYKEDICRLRKSSS